MNFSVISQDFFWGWVSKISVFDNLAPKNAHPQILLSITVPVVCTLLMRKRRSSQDPPEISQKNTGNHRMVSVTLAPSLEAQPHVRSHSGIPALKTGHFSKKIGRFSKTQKRIY